MISSCGAPTPTNVLAILLRTNASRSCNSEENSRILRDFATRELNAFLWFSLIAITAILLGEVFRLLRLWSKAEHLPGPPSPSFHNHSDLISRGNLIELLSESHKIYGPVVKLWLDPNKLLVSLNDCGLIKEMLLKAEDKSPLTGRAFRLAVGQSDLFASSFEKARKRRESLATELNERLLENANVIPIKAVDCIMERVEKFMAKGDIDCKMVSQHLAFSLLGSTLFGDEFLAWSNVTVYEEIMMMIAKDACFWASYRVSPFWKWGFWRYQSLCTELKCLTQDIIERCTRNYKHFCPHQNLHDEAVKNGTEVASAAELPDKLFLPKLNVHLRPGEEPCGNVMGVMFHGCLTTASLISNILASLVKNPDIQDEIYSEIMIVERGPMTEDQQSINKTPLLMATVYESARLLPAGPLLQRCSLKHDLSLKNGITIPSGTVLVVPIQLVQMEISTWGSDAHFFNPYRFLSRAGHESDKGLGTSFADSGEGGPFVLNNLVSNPAFLPFGSGTRACIGQKFVLQAVAALFASLLERYKIRLQSGSDNEPKPAISDCFFQLLPSPHIVFERRNYHG